MRLVCFSVLVVMLESLAWGQNSGITGRIVDPTGAVVPSAEVTVLNVDTGARYPTSANNDGYYMVPHLDPGRYQLDVKASGFKPVVHSAIVLQVEQVARVDFNLELGNVNEKVEVSGTAPLV